LLLFLSGVDDTAEEEDLFGRVVANDERERVLGVEGFRESEALAETAQAGDFIETIAASHEGGLLVQLINVIFVLIELALVLTVLLLLLFENILVDILRTSSSDSTIGDLDGGLVQEFVDVDLGLLSPVLTQLAALAERATEVVFSLLRAFLAAGDSGEVGRVLFVHIDHALLQEGLFGVQFVFDLEFWQLNVDLGAFLVAVVQKVFQLVAFDQLLLFHFRQAFLAFGQNDVHGQLVALGWDTDHFHHLVFVVLEDTAFLHDRHNFDFVAVQRLEDALFGLVVFELLSPFGFQLQSADDQHLGVIGDGILRHQSWHLVLGLGRHPLVDLLAALLRLALEVALAHFHAQA